MLPGSILLAAVGVLATTAVDTLTADDRRIDIACPSVGIDAEADCGTGSRAALAASWFQTARSRPGARLRFFVGGVAGPAFCAAVPATWQAPVYASQRRFGELLLRRVGAIGRLRNSERALGDATICSDEDDRRLPTVAVLASSRSGIPERLTTIASGEVAHPPLQLLVVCDRSASRRGAPACGAEEALLAHAEWIRVSGLSGQSSFSIVVPGRSLDDTREIFRVRAAADDPVAARIVAAYDAARRLREVFSRVEADPQGSAIAEALFLSLQGASDLPTGRTVVLMITDGRERNRAGIDFGKSPPTLEEWQRYLETQRLWPDLSAVQSIIICGVHFEQSEASGRIPSATAVAIRQLWGDFLSRRSGSRVHPKERCDAETLTIATPVGATP